MNEDTLADIIIRLKLIEASLKVNELNQANEYLHILIDKYKMSDLENTKSLIHSNDIKNATFLVEQIITSYENIFRNIESVTKLEIQSIDKTEINQPTSILIPFKKNNNWGFKDLNNDLIIDCIYDEAFDFQEGKAAVKKDGSWGFINAIGDVCSDFIYERVDSYYDGMAAVSIRSTKEYSISKNSYLISEIDKSFQKVEKIYSRNLWKSRKALRVRELKDDSKEFGGQCSSNKKYRSLVT